MRPLIGTGFCFFSCPVGEILRGERFAQWVLGEDPCAGVAELPVEASALVTSNEALALKFAEGFGGGILGDVQATRGLADRHRDLTVVETIEALGELDVEGPRRGRERSAGRGPEQPVFELDESVQALAATALVLATAFSGLFPALATHQRLTKPDSKQHTRECRTRQSYANAWHV